MRGRVNRFLNNCDIFWMALNRLVIDVRTLHSKTPRLLFRAEGTLKFAPSFIPGVDYKLNKVLKEYGGWTSVTQKSFVPSKEFYDALRLAGYSREYFDRSRAFINDKAGYTRAAIYLWQNNVLDGIDFDYPESNDLL